MITLPLTEQLAVRQSVVDERTRIDGQINRFGQKVPRAAIQPEVRLRLVTGDDVKVFSGKTSILFAQVDVAVVEDTVQAAPPAGSFTNSVAR